MAYNIVMSEDAERHFRSFSAREQRILEAAILSKLLHHPTTATRAIKKLQPNPVAKFELRVGDLRVLYNVDGNVVVVNLLGRKHGNQLFVEGEEFDDHQNDPAQPSGNGFDPDTE